MEKETKRVIDHTAGAGTSDKAEGTVREKAGEGKQALGDATNDRSLHAEGVKDEVAGKAQQAWGSAKEGVEKLADKVKDATRG